MWEKPVEWEANQETVFLPMNIVNLHTIIIVGMPQVYINREQIKKIKINKKNNWHQNEPQKYNENLVVECKIPLHVNMHPNHQITEIQKGPSC